MTTPYVSAYVKVPADCEITYSFEVGDDIRVTLGSTWDGFEIIFERQALQRLAGVVGQALRAPLGVG